MAASNKGLFLISSVDRPGFPNSVTGDWNLFTSTSNQSIHLGTNLSNNSYMVVGQSNVVLNVPMNTGSVTVSNLRSINTTINSVTPNTTVVQTQTINAMLTQNPATSNFILWSDFLPGFNASNATVGTVSGIARYTATRQGTLTIGATSWWTTRQSPDDNVQYLLRVQDSSNNLLRAYNLSQFQTSTISFNPDESWSIIKNESASYTINSATLSVIERPTTSIIAHNITASNQFTASNITSSNAFNSNLSSFNVTVSNQILANAATFSNTVTTGTASISNLFLNTGNASNLGISGSLVASKAVIFNGTVSNLTGCNASILNLNATNGNIINTTTNLLNACNAFIPGIASINTITASNANVSTITNFSLASCNIGVNTINVTGQLLKNGVEVVTAAGIVSSQWKSVDDGIYISSNVGINNDAPQFNLDVTGTINATNVIRSLTQCNTNLISEYATIENLAFINGTACNIQASNVVGQVGRFMTSSNNQLTASNLIVRGLTSTSNISATTAFASNLNACNVNVQNINFSGSLLQNNLPYKSSQWNDTIGGIYVNTLNVGIGTTAPSAPLHVVGDIIGTTTLTVPNIINENFTVSNINFTGQLLRNGSNYVDSNIVSSQWRTLSNNAAVYITSNVLIGTSNTTTDSNNSNVQLLVAGNLAVTSNLAIGGDLLFRNRVGFKGIQFDRPDNTLANISLNNGASQWQNRGDTTGIYLIGSNVGIGTSNNFGLLDVAGAIYASNVVAPQFTGLNATFSNLTAGTLSLATIAGSNFASSNLIANELAASNAAFSNLSAGGTATFSNITTTGTVTIGGDLIVQGNTSTINTQTVAITDNIIQINSSLSNTAPPITLVSGIEVNRGTESNYQFVFEEASKLFKVGQLNSLQAVATRPDTIANAAVGYWSTLCNQLVFDTNYTYSNNTLNTLNLSVTSNLITATASVTTLSNNALFSSNVFASTSLSAPLINASNISLNTTGNNTGAITFTNNDPGDMISKIYGTGDRYGMGQYSSNALRLFTSAASSNATIRFSKANDGLTASNASFTDFMTIQGSNGFVGIGKSNPQTLLDVNGTITACNIIAPTSTLTSLFNNSLTSSNITASNFQASNITTPSLFASNLSVSNLLANQASISIMSNNTLTASNLGATVLLTAPLASISSINATNTFTQTAFVNNLSASNANLTLLSACNVNASNVTVPGNVQTNTLNFNQTLTGCNVSVTGDVVIGGNLIVNGASQSISSVNVSDSFLRINTSLSNTAPSNNLVSGLEIYRGTQQNYRLVYVESNQNLQAGTIGNLQTLAFRDSNTVNSGVAYWDNTKNQLAFNSNITFSNSGFNVTNIVASNISGSNVTANSLVSDTALINTMSNDIISASNISVSNTLTATIINGSNISTSNIDISNTITSSIGVISDLSNNNLNTSNVIVNTSISAPYANISTLSNDEQSTNTLTINSNLTAPTSTIGISSNSFIDTVNINVQSQLTAYNGSIRNLSVNDLNTSNISVTSVNVATGVIGALSNNTLSNSSIAFSTSLVGPFANISTLSNSQLATSTATILSANVDSLLVTSTATVNNLVLGTGLITTLSNQDLFSSNISASNFTSTFTTTDTLSNNILATSNATIASTLSAPYALITTMSNSSINSSNVVVNTSLTAPFAILTTLSNTSASIESLSNFNQNTSNLFATFGSISNLQASNVTVTSNLIASNITVISSFTTSNLNFTGQILQNGSPYISSQWTACNGSLYITGSNVAIGKSNPTVALDIDGSLKVSSNITTSNINFTGQLLQNGAPYIGSQWTTVTNSSNTGSNVYISGSNVGINTSNPQYELDVSGSINVSSNVYSKGIVLLRPNAPGTATLSTSACNVGIGTNNALVTLDVYGSSNAFGYSNVFIHAAVGSNLNSNDGGLVFGSINGQNPYIGATGSNYNLNFATSNTIAMTISPQGRIGVGKSNPSVALDVVGSIIATSNITASNINFTGSLLQNGSPYIGSQWTTNTSNVYITGSNVGIGTTTPQYPLDVSGAGRIGGLFIKNDTRLKIINQAISSNVDFAYCLDQGTGGNTFLNCVSGGFLNFCTNNTVLMNMNSSGFLNIGNGNSASYPLQINTLTNSNTGIYISSPANAVGQYAQLALGLPNGQSALIQSLSQSGSHTDLILYGASNNTYKQSLYIQGTSGNVGIGTTPSYKLDVSGMMSANDVISSTTSGSGTGFGINRSFNNTQGWIKICKVFDFQYKTALRITGTLTTTHDMWNIDASITSDNSGNYTSSTTCINTTSVYNNTSTTLWGNVFDFVVVQVSDGAILYAKVNASAVSAGAKYMNINLITQCLSKNLDGARPVFYNTVLSLSFSSTITSATDTDVTGSGTNIALSSIAKHVQYTNTSGFTGFGTISPQGNLHIRANTTYGLTLDGSGNNDGRFIIAKNTSTDTSSIQFSQGGNTVSSAYAEVGLLNDNNFHIKTASTAGSLTDKMIISTGGNIGINTNNIQYKTVIQDGTLCIASANASAPGSLRIHGYNTSSIQNYPSILFSTRDSATDNSLGYKSGIIAVGDGGFGKSDLYFCLAGTTGADSDVTTSSARVVMTQGGNVGIGTNNPSYQLHVTGSLFYSSGGLNGSDSRIKKNIEDVDDVSALETLRQIEPKLYNYIDTKDRGTEKVWGFIAQQIKSVMNYAVETITEVVPNIYEDVTVTNNKTITLQNTSTNDFDMVNGTGRVKYSYDDNGASVNWFLTIDQIIDAKTFTVKEKLPDGIFQIFLHGQEVNNFNALKKDAIFTVTTAAVQEIDRELQSTKVLVAQQQSIIDSLIARISALEQK